MSMPGWAYFFGDSEFLIKASNSPDWLFLPKVFFDALSQRWDFSLAYAFPSFPLFQRVVEKLEASRGTFS
jgi:hypothetical protein